MTTAMWLGVAGIILVLVLVFMRVWIGFALMTVGFIGIVILKDFSFAMNVIGMEPFSQTAVYSFTCMPLFIIMGCIISNTGIGRDLFNFAQKMIGHIRGGLGMSTVIACGFFAAICGNSQVTAMTMGKVAYPEMQRAGYRDSISAGGIASGGSIGIMIPPSAGFIVFGLITDASIGKLFMAGIVPGILQALLLCLTYFIIGRVRPSWVPSTPKAKWSERGKAIAGVWPTVALIVLVLGGIYGGFFTATAAGAIGAAGAIIIALATHSLNKSILYNSFVEGVRMTSMVMMMIIGARVFLRFVTLTQITSFVTAAIVGMHVSKYVILFFVFLLYFVMGCIFDIMAGILLTVPFLYPIMTGLGFDPIWFGVFVVAMMELGEITPPIGLSCFVLSSTLKLPVERVFKGILPFLAADLVFVLIISAFPNVCLFLT